MKSGFQFLIFAPVFFLNAIDIHLFSILIIAGNFTVIPNYQLVGNR